MIWHNLCLNYNCCSHSLKRNNSQNKICTSGISNDYFCLNANTICCKHNIHSSPQSWMERWCQENMSLFMRNMELGIPSNWGKKIPNYIMCGNVPPPWAQQNKCILVQSMGWPHMHWKKPWAIKWLNELKIKQLSLGLHKISTKHDDN
jgi:hypothetical protein